MLAGDRGFEELPAGAASSEPASPESRRSIVRVDVTRIADSCGYGVPLMRYEGERPHQEASSRKRVRVHGPDAYRDYQREHNTTSLGRAARRRAARGPRLSATQALSRWP